MNNPIINPWLIYAINMIDNISSVLFVIVLFGAIGFIFGIAEYSLWHDSSYYSTDEDDIALDKKARLYLKRGGIALIIFILLNVAIPTKETMYTMVAMRYVTVENINGGVETVKSAIDYIFEKIDAFDNAEGAQEK